MKGFIINFMAYFDESLPALIALGARLRAARLRQNDTMQVFAERLGVSLGTLRDMERGAPTVQIGAWLNALTVLGQIADIDGVLVVRESLIDRARAAAATPSRQRASRRKLGQPA